MNLTSAQRKKLPSSFPHFALFQFYIEIRVSSTVLNYLEIGLRLVEILSCRYFERFCDLKGP